METGQCYLAWGRANLALVPLKAALEETTIDLKTRKAALFYLAESYRRLLMFHQAIEVMEQLCAIDAGDQNAHRLLNQLQVEQSTQGQFRVVPIPIDPAKQSVRPSTFHNYTLSPDGNHLYQVERDRHPSPNIYTLIDEPVGEGAYRQAATADFGENGFFLDRLIVNKIIGGRVWRFNSGEKPYHLESFGDGQRTDHPIEGDVADVVATHFGMDVQVVRTAFDVTTGI